MTYAKLGGVVATLLWLAVPAAVLGQAAKPPVMPHDSAGKGKCMTCHALGVMDAVKDVPASHQPRSEETCLWCHGKDAAMQTKDAPAIPHPLQGRGTCMMCHRGAMASIPKVPADHQGRTDKQCQLCHQPKAA